MDFITNTLLHDIRNAETSDDFRLKHINHPCDDIRLEIAYTVSSSEVHLLKYDPLNEVRGIVVWRGDEANALSMINDPAHNVQQELWAKLGEKYYHLFYNSSNHSVKFAALLKCRDIDYIMNLFDNLNSSFISKYNFPKKLKKIYWERIINRPDISDITKANILPAQALLYYSYHKHVFEEVRTLLCAKVSKKYLYLFARDDSAMVKKEYVKRAELETIGKFIFDPDQEVRNIAIKRFKRKSK